MYKELSQLKKDKIANQKKKKKRGQVSLVAKW